METVPGQPGADPGQMGKDPDASPNKKCSRKQLTSSGALP